MKALSNKKLQEAISWKPHKCQKEVLASKSKEIVLCAGRGFGKSMFCAYLILKELLKGGQILLVAPTYELNDRVLEHIERWIVTAFPPLRPAISYRPPQSVDFRKLKDSNIPLGRLECRSATQPEGMLGKRYDLVIVDEAPKISRKVYDSYIFQTTQVTGGKVVFIGTPMGKNWFYESWVRNKETGGSFQFKSNESPYFTDEDWERAKEILPQQVFEQEHEARFLSDAAGVFRGVKKIVRNRISADVNPDRHYTMGVDLAKHRDFTVLTVIDRSSNSVVYWDRFKDIDYPFQKKRIAVVAKRYNNARITVDATGVGEPIKDDLEREGLFVDSFVFSGKSKKELVEKLSIMIEQEKVFIPDNDILLDELTAFGYKVTDSGNVKYEAPEGLHDDAVMSLALAVWDLRGGPSARTDLQKEVDRLQSRRTKATSFI